MLSVDKSQSLAYYENWMDLLEKDIYTVFNCFLHATGLKKENTF